jgi:hypothetical protein
MNIDLILSILLIVSVFIFLPFSLIRFAPSLIVNFKDQIFLNLKPEGGSSKDWVCWLQTKGYSFSAEAREIFLSSKDDASPDLIGVAILKLNKMTLAEIREQAQNDGLLPATVEIAALLRKLISNTDLKKMNLESLVIMNPVFIDRYGTRHLLCIRSDKHSFAHKTIGTFIEKEGLSIFSTKTGFVFLNPKIEKRYSSLTSLLLKKL